jgi:hypothetical protein
MHSNPAITHLAVTVTDVASDELRGEPLAVDKLVTDSVTLGTGGPACGVGFKEHGTAAWYLVLCERAPTTPPPISWRRDHDL